MNNKKMKHLLSSPASLSKFFFGFVSLLHLYCWVDSLLAFIALLCGFFLKDWPAADNYLCKLSDLFICFFVAYFVLMTII